LANEPLVSSTKADACATLPLQHMLSPELLKAPFPYPPQCAHTGGVPSPSPNLRTFSPPSQLTRPDCIRHLSLSAHTQGHAFAGPELLPDPAPPFRSDAAPTSVVRPTPPTPHCWLHRSRHPRSTSSPLACSPLCTACTRPSLGGKGKGVHALHGRRAVGTHRTLQNEKGRG
jgi:hypothetical protein